MPREKSTLRITSDNRTGMSHFLLFTLFFKKKKKLKNPKFRWLRYQGHHGPEASIHLRMGGSLSFPDQRRKQLFGPSLGKKKKVR